MADAMFFGADEEEDTSARVQEPLFFGAEEEEDVQAAPEKKPDEPELRDDTVDPNPPANVWKNVKGTGIDINPADYDTQLTPEEEAKFQEWKKQNAPDDSGEDYDFRGAFKEGLTADPQSGHWSDKYKKPNHETFSNESQYVTMQPNLAGSWDENGQYVENPETAKLRKRQTARENAEKMRKEIEDTPVVKEAIKAGLEGAAQGAAEGMLNEIHGGIDFVGSILNSVGHLLGGTPTYRTVAATDKDGKPVMYAVNRQKHNGETENGDERDAAKRWLNGIGDSIIDYAAGLKQRNDEVNHASDEFFSNLAGGVMPIIATGAAATPMLMTTGYVDNYDNLYKTAKESGKSEDEAHQIASAGGVVNAAIMGVLSKVPLKTWLGKRFGQNAAESFSRTMRDGGASSMKDIINNGTKWLFKNTAKDVAVSTAESGVLFGAQGAANEGMMEHAAGKELDPMKITMAGYEGAKSGVAMSLAMGGVQLIGQRAQYRRDVEDSARRRTESPQGSAFNAMWFNEGTADLLQAQSDGVNLKGRKFSDLKSRAGLPSDMTAEEAVKYCKGLRSLGFDENNLRFFKREKENYKRLGLTEEDVSGVPMPGNPDVTLPPEAGANEVISQKLRLMGVEPVKFTIPTEAGKNGVQVPRFTKVGVKDNYGGVNGVFNIAIDENAKVAIIDNGDGTYTAYDNYQNSETADSVSEACEKAQMLALVQQYQNEERKSKKAEVARIRDERYGTKNVVTFATMSEAHDAIQGEIDAKGKCFGMSSADSLAQPNRQGCNAFYTPDGTTVVILDNIARPSDIERVLAHEIVGHGGPNGDFGGSRGAEVEFAENIRSKAFDKAKEGSVRTNMAKTGRTEDEARQVVNHNLREVFAHYASDNLDQNPSAMNKVVNAVNNAARKLGIRKTFNASDVKVMISRWQKEANGTGGGLYGHDRADRFEFFTPEETSEAPKAPEVTATPETKTVPEPATDFRKQYGEYGLSLASKEEHDLVREKATDDEIKHLVEMHDNAETEEDFNKFYDEQDRVLKRIKDEAEAARKASEPRKQASVAEVVEQAQTPFSDAERTALESAADMSGIDASGEMPTTKDFLGVLSADAPIVRLNPAKVDRTDAILPNMKKDANRNTGITKPLEGEWHPTMGGIGAAWLTKDGKLTVITGRHRSELAERKGKSMLYYLYREADGFTKEQAQIYDAVANIHDEKGTINDYIGFLDHVKPTREQAEKAGILYGKGLTAWSIYSDASEAVRSATALDGNPDKGQISPAQATVIAQAAPKDANPRNTFIQSVLLRAAKGGMGGKSFVGYCREMTRQLQSDKVNKNLLIGEQMDLFADESFLAMEALAKRRNEYRQKKSNGYAQVATNLRAALNREGKLELTDEYATDLGVTDKTDKTQLEKAYNTAVERAEYWDPSGDRILSDEDTKAMDAEVNAAADKKASKLAEIAAKRAAVKAGKPLPKKADVSKTEKPAEKKAEGPAAGEKVTPEAKSEVKAEPKVETKEEGLSGISDESLVARHYQLKADGKDVGEVGKELSKRGIYSTKKTSIVPYRDEFGNPRVGTTPEITTYFTKDGNEISKFDAADDKPKAASATTEKKSAVAEKPKEAPKPERKRTVKMKNADEEKRVKSLLDNIEFDSPELDQVIREKQTALSGGTSRNQNPSGNEYGKKWKIFKPGTRNVDIGAGRFNKATEFLADIGVTNLPFDPVNRTRAENESAAQAVRDNPADTATVHNVLNVIDNDAVMDGIINQAARAIKKNGWAIFTVYEGNRSGKATPTRDGFQRNAKAASYVPHISKYFGQVETHGNVITARKPKDVGPAFWAYDSKFEDGIDFASEEFDYEKFGKLVTGVGKLVDALVENGHNSFESLARYISEADAAKFSKAEPVLQDVWNAIAKQKKLARVSDDDAERIYGIIHKEATNGESGTDNGNTGSVRSTTGGGERSGSVLADGHVREQDSDGRVDNLGPRVVSGLGEGVAKEQAPSEGEDSGRKTPEGNVAVGDSAVPEGSERAAGRDSAVDGNRPERKVVKAVAKAAKETKVAPAHPDFVMTKAVEDAILEPNQTKRVENNLAAIKLINDLAKRDFIATPEEQETLAKYVGWGGLSGVFDHNYDMAWNYEQSGDTEGALARASRAPMGKRGYELYKELKTILDESMFDSARASSTTAFYTPIEMVRAEHAALRALGLKGGRFLGPSAGVGNYASAAGEYQNAVNWQFVEKDQLSGMILKALFPNQRVNIMGFEETKFPEGFFDLAIDNVPYADVPITDKGLSANRFMIHDYFFAKTLSKLRPGGVMMFLTSTGTLDKGSGTLRKFLSEHGGKIIGAVRLPNGFFSQNANTEAAADLVIIQRVNGEVDNTAFEGQHPFAYEEDEHWDKKKHEWVTDKKPLSYNKYFADHPEQVIGKMEAVNGQYGKTLHYSMPTADDLWGKFGLVRQAINRALEGINKGAFLNTATVAEKPTHTPIYDEEGLRQGNISIKDGKVYVKSGEMLEPVEIPKDRQLSKELAKRMRSATKIIDGVVKLRKSLRAVVDAEMRGCTDEELKPLLADLNAEYDLFKAKNGSLHDKWVTPFVLLDKADGNRILALERVGKDNSVTKADIFTKRVISIGARVEKADTPKEALVVCYSENGVIVPERVGELLGVSAEDAVKMLKESGDAFENPQTGRLEPAWEYLSGRVRTKLAMARAAVESGDQSFHANVEALEKVQPPDVKLEDVEIKFGATWADPESMKDFLKDAFGVQHLNVALAKSELTGAWTFDLGGRFNEDTPWGKTVWPAAEFIRRVLNNESMESWHTSGEGKDKIRWRDEAETEANKLAAEKLHQAYGQFLRESETWAEPSFKRYNDVNNDNVAIKLPDNIMPFKASGMSEDAMRKLFEDGDPSKPKKGREYQSQVIARGVLGGTSLCLAHCVGAGKTMEMQSIGMLGRHLGMFKKSMYVVPNHMLNQFCNEFIEAFPNANILKMTEDDVKPANRRAFFAQCANGDWDAIVVKHSTFSKKLGMSPKYQKEYAEKQMKNLELAISEMQEQGDRISVKKAEKMKERLEQKLKELQDAEGKDTEIVAFEELGVDQLFVDEAHNFKGLPIVTRQGRVGGLSQGDSQRAVDMEMKTEYVQSLHNGDRGVVFASGTPLSNAPAIEAYVFLRFLAPKALREQGLQHFDDFINAFGRITTETEFSVDGKTTKEKDKVSAFVNIPELMRLFKSRVDIVNADQLDIPRPKPKYRMIDVDMTPAQEQIMEAVAEQSKTPGGKEWRSKYMDMTWVAKYACITPRMLGYTDGGNKIPRVVAEVKKVYDDTSDKKGAQLIFTDRFQNGYELAAERVLTKEVKGDGDAMLAMMTMAKKSALKKSGIPYNLNEEIKAMLVQQGIPESEIAIIQDLDKAKGDKDQNKEALFAKVRNGEVRILIGSRPKMGEGTNVQKRLAAIHLLHPGWKPAEDDQAIGRIIRFGNEYPEGQIFYYLTKGNANIGSYETKNHELIGVKSRLIQQVMHGDETIRSIEMDESAMDRDMLMGLASGNKALLELIDVRKKTHKLELNSESTATSARRMKDKSETNARVLEREKEEWKETKAGIERWHNANDGKDFALTTPDGRKLDKAKDIADFVCTEVVKGLTMDQWDRYRHGPFDIGNFNGVPFTLVWNDDESKFYVAVRDLGVAYKVDNVGFVPSFTYQNFGALKAQMLRAADPDYVKNVETGFADREKMVQKQEADSVRLGKEAEALRTELIEMRKRQEQLEREVTPLLVKTTADHKWATYGNWAIGKAPSGAFYIATKANVDVKIQAPTVREILPKLDAYDFGNPSTSAKKTMDLPQSVLGQDRQFETKGVDEVDFYSDDLDTADFNEKRRFDVWENGNFHPNHIGGYTRNQASAYARKLYGPSAVAYELGAWNKHQQNVIISRRERQIRGIAQQSPVGIGKTGAWLVAGIRAGIVDAQSARAAHGLVSRFDASGLARNSMDVARLRASDLFGTHSVVVNGWEHFEDGTTLIPLTGQTKYSFRNIVALNQVFPNTWELKGIGAHEGRLYGVVKTDKVGTPINADSETKHRFLENLGFKESKFAEYFKKRGVDYWEKDGIGIDVNELKLGQTASGEVFPYNVECSVRPTEWVSGGAEVDFMSDELDPAASAYSQSEDKTPTEDVSREVFGMTNDDLAAEMRAAHMEPKPGEKKSDEVLRQQAEVLLSRPEYMDKLSRAVYKFGRPTRDYENIALGELFYVRQQKVNDLQSILDDLKAIPDDQAAVDPEYAKMLKETKADLAEARQLLYETGVAKRQGASEQGRALRSNRMKLDKNDLSFAGISNAIAEAAGGADRITPEMEAKIKALSDDFTKLDGEGQEIYSARLKAYSEKIVNEIKNGGKIRQATEAKLGDEGKRVKRNYFDAMAQIEVHANEVGGTLIGLADQMYPSWGKWLKAIGEYHCFMNPDIDEEGVIKAITADVNQFVGDVDGNQVRDMLTGFGFNYRQSRYDSQRLMNDLRSQARMKRQLDYMNERNELPPATGMVRDEPSLEARKLAREVQERKKEVDETHGGANRLKGALQSAKTRIKNRIEDLEAAIASGEKIERTVRSVAEDEELRGLKSRRDSLQAIYDSMFKTEHGKTDEQRVKAVELALSRELEKTIEDLARARSGDFSKRAKPSRVTSATADAIRQQIADTKDMILELKKAAYEFGLTPDEVAKRHAQKMKAREDAIVRMAERIERGDIRPNKKPQPPMPPEMQKRYDEMGKQLKKAHQKLADMRLEAENATTPKFIRKGIEYAKFFTAAQRALRATLDFSATMRQAARITLGHPVIGAQSFGKAFRAMKSETNLQAINDEIMSDENVQEAVSKYGLHLREIDGENARDVEMFHGMERNRVRIFGKDVAITDIPFFGELMLKSERHYLTYLNAVSAELYNAIVNDKKRFPGGATPWQKKMVCDMINVWNGSGALSKERRNALQKAWVNEVFWAPGLAISRVQGAIGYDIWHPLTAKGIANDHGGYDSVSAEERKTMAKIGASEHFKSTLAMIAVGALLKFLFGSDDDWFKFGQADWYEKLLLLASPNVGNTTIDLTGGEASVYRLIHTLATGTKKSATGRTQVLGETYGASTHMQVAQRFMEGKLSPWLSEAVAIMSGKDYAGQEYSVGKALVDSTIPLTFTDIYDQIDQNGIGKTLITAPLTLFGAGGSTYDRKPYENAVNPFTEALKEYQAIEKDDDLDEDTREEMLENIRSSNPLMRDEVREDIAADLKLIRHDEYVAKRNEKRDGEPDTMLLEQIERDKANLLERIRAARR